MVSRLALRFGLEALLEESDDDRPPVERPPEPERRDASTGHRWLTCKCGVCARRRERERPSDLLLGDVP